MDSKVIEKLDKQRYRAVLLQAAGLLVMFLEVTAGYIMHWNTDSAYIAVAGYLGLPLFLAGGIWYLALNRRIGRDKEIKAALNNEMYVSYKYRSQRLAFWVSIAALGAGVIAGVVIRIWSPEKMWFQIMICEMILFVSFAALKISWLVYNKK